MPNTREMELWRLVNKAFQNSCEKFGDIFAKDVTRDLLDNGVTVQKWIPVTERLPEGRSFMVTDTDGYVGEAYLREGKIYWMCDDCDDFWRDVKPVDVTHWMPLPEPPKGE